MKNWPDYDETLRLIPGGAHTYSRGDDQFPAVAPRYLERGDGAFVWDERDRRFLDWMMGLRTMTLGYNRREIDEAAIAQIKKGNNFGRPSFIETELARDIVDLIPSAEMVKFAKNGSTVTTAAVKLARAFTGRDYVAFCKDHPFFSYDDWFIGTTPCNNGIPESHYQYSVPFRYNDLASLERVFAEHPGQIAAVIMEPCTSDEPRDDFLRNVQALCRREGAVFIIDEMITGFRWHRQGAQTYFGLGPDLSTFGKGIANGYSLAVLAGRREIMELGGIHHDQKRVFLVSTTHGGENVSLAAARAALKFYNEYPVVEHIWRIGRMLIDGLNAIAREVGLERHFHAFGYPPRPEYALYDTDGTVSLPLRTLFVQEMINQGVTIPYIVPSYAHTDVDVEATVEAARKALNVVGQAVERGWRNYLIGDPIKPVFREYN